MHCPILNIGRHIFGPCVDPVLTNGDQVKVSKLKEILVTLSTFKSIEVIWDHIML